MSSLIDQRRKDAGTAVLFVTHEVNPVLPYVDRVLYLVDGRFRVACALEALARCRPHTILLFHDFWNRTPYHPVLAFTDWLGSCDSLAILRRKAVIDPANFEAVRRLHRLNPQ